MLSSFVWGASYTFYTDTGYYYASSHEGKITTSVNFLNSDTLRQLPFKVGLWKGEGLVHHDPNILYMRGYRHTEGDYLYFAAVHGAHESVFHTPEICYVNDGWTIPRRAYQTLKAGGNTFPVRFLVAEKNGHRHLVVYWYMWGNSRHAVEDGCTMLRFSAEDFQGKEEDVIARLGEFLEEMIRPPSGAPALTLEELEQAFAKRYAPPERWKKPWDLSVKWLESQMVPNEFINSPDPFRRHLVLSYEQAAGANPQFARSAIYDDALAVIAFSLSGKFTLASRVIDGALRLMRPTGEFWFSYNTHNTWPDENDHDGAMTRSGATAWMGYALCVYVNAVRALEPRALETRLELQDYLDAAERVAHALLARQVTLSGDNREGLIMGGEGSYALLVDLEKNEVVETYRPGPVLWCSVEHNIDMYFFLKLLNNLRPKREYRLAMEAVQNGLLSHCWNPVNHQLNRGARKEGSDPLLALDCASWGAIFLVAAGKPELAKSSLEQLKRYESEDLGVKGFRPYSQLTIHEQTAINAFYYPKQPDLTWDEIPFVWPEGTLGAAMALVKLGRRGEAERLVEEMVKAQNARGGVWYASKEIPHQFSNKPSVAGTAWLMMCLAALSDPFLASWFWE